MAKKNINKVNKELVNITVEDHTQKVICEDIEEAIRYHSFLVNNGVDVVIAVNGIIMPEVEKDESFFYASVKAAEEEKVWVEEAHGFFSKEFRDMFEAGCFDTDNPEDLEEFWEETMDRIYQDIYGYLPVTGGEGRAVVYDHDLAKLCEEKGWDTLLCTEEDPDLGMTDYWLVFPKDGEEEYFEEMSSEEEDAEKETEEDSRFYDSLETGEICFEGKYLHSYFDVYEKTAIFFRIGKDGNSHGYTVEIPMSEKVWENLSMDIEENPDSYAIRMGENGGILFHQMMQMSTAVWNEAGWDFDFPTGWEYLEVNGDWVLEFQDEEEDSPILMFNERDKEEEEQFLKEHDFSLEGTLRLLEEQRADLMALVHKLDWQISNITQEIAKKESRE